MQRVDRTRGGKYYCAAHNSEGEGVSNVVTLNVMCKLLELYCIVIHSHLLLYSRSLFRSESKVWEFPYQHSISVGGTERMSGQK